MKEQMNLQPVKSNGFPFGSAGVFMTLPLLEKAGTSLVFNQTDRLSIEVPDESNSLESRMLTAEQDVMLLHISDHFREEVT